MYDSKRLIDHKFSNENVQNDISYWPIKIIEDKKTGKPQYVIKVNNEERKYFPEEVSSMILEYLKKQAEIYNGNKEIKKAVITVPAHFNNLQRKATIEAANKAGLEVIKLINELTVAAIAYGEKNYSDKERKVLIFYIGRGTFDVSIVKIKGNEYKVLASEGEEHLGGEDFNQRLFDYVIKEIKKIDVFKNIQKEVILKGISRLKKKIEIIKIESSKNKSLHNSSYSVLFIINLKLLIPNKFGINSDVCFLADNSVLISSIFFIKS
jgi:molecular chaperone DnaK (HSP70)